MMRFSWSTLSSGCARSTPRRDSATRSAGSLRSFFMGQLLGREPSGGLRYGQCQPLRRDPAEGTDRGHSDCTPPRACRGTPPPTCFVHVLRSGSASCTPVPHPASPGRRCCLAGGRSTSSPRAPRPATGARASPPECGSPGARQHPSPPAVPLRSTFGSTGAGALTGAATGAGGGAGLVATAMMNEGGFDPPHQYRSRTHAVGIWSTTSGCTALRPASNVATRPPRARASSAR